MNMWPLLLTCRNILTYGLYLSVKTGQFIVTAVVSTVASVINFINKIIILWTIVLEDFIIFLQDLRQRIFYILGLVSSLVEYLTTAGNTVISAIRSVQQVIWTSILLFYESIFNGLTLILNGIGNVFVGLKHMIILFGDGVWFIVVFIPKSIISLIPLSLHYLNHLLIHIIAYIIEKIANVCNLIIDVVVSCYVFITDVPTESCIGIVIAACFFYIFFQFYSVLKNYLRVKVSLFFRGLRLKYHQLKGKVCRILRSSTNQSRPLQTYTASISHETDDNKGCDNRFCVICQDRAKCVLILPCKHLCLCNECTPRLLRYSGCCPICRKRINRTMKIFT